MSDKASTDAGDTLEQIRSEGHADVIAADLLRAVYAVEHENQFEDERGPTRALLRDLIAQAIEASS